MIRIMDKFLLFVFSLVTGLCSLLFLFLALRWIKFDSAAEYLDYAYHTALIRNLYAVFLVLVFLICLRFFYISIRRSHSSGPSIDQKTSFGEIRISLATVENLSLKSASIIKGVHDVKTRVKVSDMGLEINLRAMVDGESSIPALTEEIQRAVKFHIEDITGIPVAAVSVYVANIIQPASFKSRVE